MELRRPTGRNVVSRVLARALVGGATTVALLSALAPAGAGASWTRVAQGPTATSPYFVCPREHARASCQLIQDPTRGYDRRGPLHAGAIRLGPVQEVSPALFGSGVEGGYSPSDLRNAYGLGSASGGSGQTVAIVDAYDDPNAEADLREYRAKYNLPPCDSSSGCFRKVDQAGGSSYPPPNRLWAREISLDLDMVSAICPNCRILLVEARSTSDVDLAAGENQAVALGATEISNSFAEAESSTQSAAYDHPGIPITAAAGDHSYGVESPASYPGVIAVGGTSLRPAAERRGRSWAETVWHQASGEVTGTGSGCSHEPKPVWQTDACPYRTTNDLAVVGDPNTPVSAYDSYEMSPHWLLLGGTSASAPIVAAAMALANPYTRQFAGAQGLYLDAASGPGFNDIVMGANGSCGNYLCEAIPGYDGPSGLGSLHGIPEVPQPTAITGAPAPITATEATLLATVDPHGAEVSGCSFDYGPTGSYGASVPCSTLPAPGIGPAPVSARIAGLAGDSTYHVRVAISYRGGSGSGSDQTFSTPAAAPAVVTEAASAVSQSGANVNARVNPNGAPVTTCRFEYGISTAYGSSAACASAPGNERSYVPVSARLTGLAANSTYHFRVTATGQGGVSYGGDLTVAVPPEPPTVVTGQPSAATSTSATLTASVDPHGALLTSCEFEVASAESYVPCTQPPGAQSGGATVSAVVRGLRPNTRFSYRILAANAGGTSYGAIVEFVSPPTSALEQSALQRGRGLHRAELIGTALRVGASGVFAVHLRCLASLAPCRGSVTLQALGAARAGAGPPLHGLLELASRSFTTAPGSTVMLRMRLTPKGRKLLARSRLVRARATVVTGAPYGIADSWRAALTLRLARAGAGH